MQKNRLPKRISLLRISKAATFITGGAMVFQTTGCAFDDVLGANIVTTLLQFFLSIFLGGGI